MSAARIESLIWVLVYGGLFAICLGVALQRAGEGYGWSLVGLGAAAAAAGAILIWVRSRMRDPRDS